jgi:hypothetical protein
MSRVLLALAVILSSLSIGCSSTEQEKRANAVKRRPPGITNNVEDRAEPRKTRRDTVDEQYNTWFKRVMD